jgi:hypothetical protein
MGLDRREMIWNSSDEYRRIVNKYGTDASFVMAHVYGMMPLPVGRMGAMSYTPIAFIGLINYIVLAE